MTDETTETLTEESGRTPRQKVQDFIEMASQQNRRLDKTAIEAGRRDALSGMRAIYGPIWEAAEADISGNIKKIKAVRNPIHRFIMLCEAAKLGWMHNRALDEWRRERREAIIALYWKFKWGRKRIVDFIGATDRQKRIVDAAVKNTDRRDGESSPLTEEEAMDKAKRTHGVIAGRVELNAWATTTRDTMIVDLSEGRYDGSHRITDTEWDAGRRGYKWPNAVLARLANLKTATIAEYRTGVKGHAKQYQSDAA